VSDELLLALLALFGEANSTLLAIPNHRQIRVTDRPFTPKRVAVTPVFGKDCFH
jgi:hypothetical protein